MQVSFEIIQGLWRRITIIIANSDIEKVVNNELINMAKKVCINGFRKGKVPIKIIKQRYRLSVLQSVLSDLMQRHFIRIITEEKINLAGGVKYQHKEFKMGEDFLYTVEFEIYPEINLKGLENIKVEKPIVVIKDQDIDFILETLRKQKAIWQETKEKADINSRVTIDFKGRINGESFEGSDVSDFILVIGEKACMIPAFEEVIVGHHVGEEFSININFSDNYHIDHLKGKVANFTITLKKVEQQILPELTEEFINQFGVSDGSIETLRAEIYKNMERELKKAIRHRIKTQVLDGLVKENKIEVPSVILKNEVNLLRQKVIKDFSDNKKKVLELPFKIFEKQAKYRVIASLLLNKIINEYSLIVDNLRVQSFIEEIASVYEDPSEVIEYYNKNKKLMDTIRNLVLEEQAIEVLLEKVKVTDKEIKFQELVNQS